MRRRVLRNERGLRLGEDHQKARLTQAQVDEAFELRAAGFSQQTIADRFGVARRTVRDVLTGRSWNKPVAYELVHTAREDTLVWTFAPLLRCWHGP